MPERFTKKNCIKTNQKEFKIKKKTIKRKGDKLYVKWKGYNNLLNSWIDKKRHEYFPKPKSLGTNVKLELDFYIYATREDLKNATAVDTSDFAKKADLI